jgi:hypothetical protein
VSEAVYVFIMGVFLFAVYFFTRWGKIRAAHRAGRKIVNELKNRKASCPETAVELKDVERNLLRAGLRTFRPEAMHMLLQNNIVGITDDRRYYLL